MEDLAAANQGVVGETVLWRLGNPSFVSAPNAIAEEMRFGAEDTVEVDGDGHVALGRSQRRRQWCCSQQRLQMTPKKTRLLKSGTPKD